VGSKSSSRIDHHRADPHRRRRPHAQTRVIGEQDALGRAPLLARFLDGDGRGAEDQVARDAVLIGFHDVAEHLVTLWLTQLSVLCTLMMRPVIGFKIARRLASAMFHSHGGTP
jgi:hypothetical protein